MSSTRDAGYYADQQYKAHQTKCDKSPTGEHKFTKHGISPSTWYVCKHCGMTTYSK